MQMRFLTRSKILRKIFTRTTKYRNTPQNQAIPKFTDSTKVHLNLKTMPTNKTRTLITITPEEHENLRREALETGKSLNNYLRVKIGLPELKRGETIEQNRKKPNHGKNREAI